ncbi:MAG: hypothetical protein AABM29_02420 [Actinomycetota bacterium]
MGVLWKPLVISILVGAALYGVFLLIFKRGPKAGAIASLVSVAFFYYGIYLDKVSWSEGLFMAIWLALFGVAIFLVARTRRQLWNLTLILTVYAVVQVLVPAIKVASYQANHPAISTSDSRLWTGDVLPSPPAQPSNAQLPDIYVIIPDDYARGDLLQKYWGYDNSRFYDQLKQRGFLISNNSRAPYSDSELNIASALNMGYMDGMPRILGRTSEDVRGVRRLISDSRARKLLESIGYDYVQLDTDEVTWPAGNPDISFVATPDSFGTLWMEQTVLGSVGGSLGFNPDSTDERFRGAIKSVFSKLEAVPDQPGPKFVVFHTLLPHEPYIFGANGQDVTNPDKSEEGQNSDLGMKLYLGQLRGISQMLLDAVDAIQSKSETPPVIVIQADEGFEGNPDLIGERTMQDIRIKGLLALSLPGAGTTKVPKPPNVVNTLRFVMNEYFGTHYPMLDTVSYPEGDLPYQFEAMPVRGVAK